MTVQDLANNVKEKDLSEKNISQLETFYCKVLAADTRYSEALNRLV